MERNLIDDRIAKLWVALLTVRILTAFNLERAVDEILRKVTINIRET